jgi:hypothetical protein
MIPLEWMPIELDGQSGRKGGCHMGVTLGWVALALAALGIPPQSELEKPPITYTVRMIEADGVDWREAVFASLKPVARQGSATIWTLPLSASIRLLSDVTKSSLANVVLAPKVTSQSGSPATIQCRSKRQLVTQAAWTNEPSSPACVPENIRVGWHTTVVGRKLDQGILVQLVFEDTVVRAVHRVSVDRSVVSNGACASATAACERHAFAADGDKATGLMGIAQAALKDAGVDMECSGSETCCQATTGNTKDAAIATACVDVPEIDNREVLGEWLIPRGDALLVSFGAFTVADNDGKAIVKERLALIEAVDERIALPSAFVPNPVFPAPATTIPPPAPLVPHLMPKIEELPKIALPIPVTALPSTFVPNPVFPAPATTIPPPAPLVPQLMPKIEELPKIALPTPVMPSRSIPQRVHADGTPAELPPLPDDEADLGTSESESAEPMPSPQTKKPREPKTKPTTDSDTSKAEFSLPKMASMFLPSLFMPSPSAGFQFMLPIKPLSFKLPFGQRVEIEVFGRVVPDTETR